MGNALTMTTTVSQFVDPMCGCWHLGTEARGLQRQSQLEALLRKVPARLGGGKMQMSLYAVLPSAGVRERCSALSRILPAMVEGTLHAHLVNIFWWAAPW